jgi:hypothetical protein
MNRYSVTDDKPSEHRHIREEMEASGALLTIAGWIPRIKKAEPPGRLIQEPQIGKAVVCLELRRKPEFILKDLFRRSWEQQAS